jgi:hypothetical protein
MLGAVAFKRKEHAVGKYARHLWFPYEFLTGKMLPLEDLRRGNYIETRRSKFKIAAFGLKNARRWKRLCHG